MNRITKFIFLAFLCPIVAMAQTEEEQDKWEEYSTPSSTHKFIAKYDGKWKAEIKMYNMDVTEPVIYQGTAISKMIMGGRYQVTDFTAIMDGQNMEGNSLLAYDNHTQEFTSTWIDNFGTGMLILYGTWNENNFKQIDFEGNMVMPFSEEEVFVRQEYVFESDDLQSFKMWYDYGEGEVLSMEIVYRRL